MNGLRLSERYAFAFGMMGLVAVGCISVGSAVTAAETVQIQVLKNNTILFSKSVQLQGMNSIVIDDTRDASLARTRQTNTEVRVGNTIIVSPKSVADQQLSCVIDIKNISVDPGLVGHVVQTGIVEYHKNTWVDLVADKPVTVQMDSGTQSDGVIAIVTYHQD